MTSAAVAPDYIEPLREWRVWRVVQRDGRLVLASVVKPAVWPVGRSLAAACLEFPRWPPWRKAHEAPLATCACGIYGSSLERVVEYAHDRLPRATAGWVVGVVALWGTVVTCERGFRASHAYPSELWVPWPERRGGFDREDVALQLTDYGVPVRLLDGLAHEAAELLPHETAGAARSRCC